MTPIKKSFTKPDIAGGMVPGKKKTGAGSIGAGSAITGLGKALRNTSKK
jgi:hypothetical protein